MDTILIPKFTFLYIHIVSYSGELCETSKTDYAILYEDMILPLARNMSDIQESISPKENTLVVWKYGEVYHIYSNHVWNHMEHTRKAISSMIYSLSTPLILIKNIKESIPDPEILGTSLPVLNPHIHRIGKGSIILNIDKVLNIFPHDQFISKLIDQCNIPVDLIVYKGSIYYMREGYTPHSGVIKVYSLSRIGENNITRCLSLLPKGKRDSVASDDRLISYLQETAQYMYGSIIPYVSDSLWKYAYTLFSRIYTHDKPISFTDMVVFTLS